ncbi:MAG: hypothetical protein ABH986_01725 [archaeon]
MIAEFLQKNFNAFNYGNYIAAKIQLSIVLMVLTAFISFIAGFEAIAVIEGILSLVLFHSMLEAKKKFEKDFTLFLLVFGSVYIVVQLIWLNNFLIPAENRMDVGFLLIFILIVIAVAFSVLGKKNSVHGRVLSSNGKITVVETEFDLRSFTKGGKHLVETEKKFRENEAVKVRIKKSFLGKKIEII